MIRLLAPVCHVCGVGSEKAALTPHLDRWICGDCLKKLERRLALRAKRKASPARVAVKRAEIKKKAAPPRKPTPARGSRSPRGRAPSE